MSENIMFISNDFPVKRVPIPSRWMVRQRTKYSKTHFYDECIFITAANFWLYFLSPGQTIAAF